jgi:hypothetical protein
MDPVVENGIVLKTEHIHINYNYYFIKILKLK